MCFRSHFGAKCLILLFLRIYFFGTPKFVSLRIFHLLWHLSVIRIILHVQCWLQTHVSDYSRIFRNSCISFRRHFFGLVTNTTEAEKSADCLKWCWCLQWCWRQKHYFGHQHLKRVNNNNRRQHRCSWFCVPDHFFAILRFRL